MLFCTIPLDGHLQNMFPYQINKISSWDLAYYWLDLVSFFFVANLKRICETENGSLEIKDDTVRRVLGKNGLATQCIQTKNAISSKDVILKQLCLKINSKMGGANNDIARNTITRLVSLPYWIIFLMEHSLTKKEFVILHWRRGLGLIFISYQSIQVYSPVTVLWRMR